MKNLLCLGVIASGLFTTAGAYEEFNIGFPIETELHFESSMNMDMELTDMTVSVNGQELPAEAVDQIRETMPMPEGHSRSSATMTEFLGAEGETLTQARVHYESIEKEVLGSDDTEQSESPLEGRTLLLSLIEGEVVTTIDDDGEELDEAFLKHHRLQPDYQLLLPDDEASVGDSWKLNDEDANMVLGLVQGPAIFEGDEEEEDEDSFEAIMRDAAEKDLEVTFDSYRDHEGSKCAVLTYTARVVAELDDAAAIFGDEDGELNGSVVLDLTIEGELLFDIELERALSTQATFEGTMIMDLETTQEIQGNELLFEMTIEMTLTAEAQATWSD